MLINYKRTTFSVHHIGFFSLRLLIRLFSLAAVYTPLRLHKIPVPNRYAWARLGLFTVHIKYSTCENRATELIVVWETQRTCQTCR